MSIGQLRRALANCQNSLYLNFSPRHFEKMNVGNVIGLYFCELLKSKATMNMANFKINRKRYF